ncbi:MAG: P-type conjugative transfer protein TrbJ [Burkholderiaceae bacterium]
MSIKVKKILAAKSAVLALLVSGFVSQPTQAGIPVIDGGNLSQNIITATKQAASVAKQIQQYQTQLQQYENMLQNTVAPAAYIWDMANGTINKLLQLQDTLNYYKNQTGSIDAYLSRYQNVGYYRTSPCFTDDGCTPAQRQAVLNANANGSEAQKRANDAVLRGVDQQQQTLRADAANLARLQSQATGATGQMQAIQAANQLASAQANQLLQIRGLLVAQQNAAATHAQVVADREAQQTAADEQFRSGRYTKSPAKSW